MWDTIAQCGINWGSAAEWFTGAMTAAALGASGFLIRLEIIKERKAAEQRLEDDSRAAAARFQLAVQAMLRSIVLRVADDERLRKYDEWNEMLMRDLTYVRHGEIGKEILEIDQAFVRWATPIEGADVASTRRLEELRETERKTLEQRCRDLIIRLALYKARLDEPNSA